MSSNKIIKVKTVERLMADDTVLVRGINIETGQPDSINLPFNMMPPKNFSNLFLEDKVYVWHDSEPEKQYTPPPVTGYRKLSQSEVDLMNKIKAKGDEIGELVAELHSMEELDQRWVAIGKTDLQTGIMALVRAVAQPGNF